MKTATLDLDIDIEWGVLHAAGWRVLRQPIHGLQSDCAPAWRGVTDLADHPHAMAREERLAIRATELLRVWECVACGIQLWRTA